MDLLGPWWRSIASFVARSLAFGASLAAVSARISRWLALLGRSRRSVAYLLLVVLVPLFPFGIAAVVTGVVSVLGGRLLERARDGLTGGTGLRATRLALGAAVLVAAPGYVVAVGDLVGRGPG